MRRWQIHSPDGVDALELVDVEPTAPGPGEVRLRVRASAINYRDLSTIRDPVGRGLPLPRVPNSDAVGEIIAVGPGVDGYAVGDRVASCFFADWQDGPCSAAIMAGALGGPLDGVLAEEVNLKATGVVPVPAHLGDVEAATLPCAALTAWQALSRCQVTAGDTVLLLGTGGVSIFALQFAHAMGLRAIVTSSSDEKLGHARDLGAWHTINYRAQEDWQDEVVSVTGGGVDAVVEVGGAGTLERSVAATRVAGTVALIGVLTGGKIDPVAIMRKSIRLQGIYCGPRNAFLAMNRAIETHQLRPVVHEVFCFDHARDAYHAMAGAGHFGKLVIKMPD